MSSALDEDTRQTLDAGRETAGAMLRSAQKDLQKVFIVFLIGFLGTFYALQLWVWEFLKNVTRAQMEASTAQDVRFIAQTPFDVILLQGKISIVAGIIVALPIFVYFSRDALKARGMWPQSPVKPWKLALIGLMAAVLFFAGLVYGYSLFFPLMFKFLANNAISVGFSPRYSIVKWAQFIFLLTLSFGFAAQMPLAITGLSYSGIVKYETFRDKWRHAVVLIFVFGAFFSPPDPFTQIMWAVPLLVLYAASLYLAKVVVTAKRGSQQIDLGRTVRSQWNIVLGFAILFGGATNAFYSYGGLDYVNWALAYLNSTYRVVPLGQQLPYPAETTILIYSAAAGAVGLLLGLFYGIYRDIEATAGPQVRGQTGDPAAIDLTELDAAGVRAAPPEAFTGLTEEEAMGYASAAIDDGDNAKAQAILDRFDEAEESREEEPEEGNSVPGVDDDVGDRASRASGTLLEGLTDGERDEDDIGGYYKDVAFIVDSLRSRSFILVGWFMVVLAGTFAWLYSGGIGTIFDGFLAQMPAAFDIEQVNVITLHPVEALIFEVKFSTLIAAIATLPLLAFFAWPALRERNFVRGHRSVIFGWAAVLLGGLLGGLYLGYVYIAPTVISYLAADALAANVVISYQITDFFWLIFFTTAGIGILADIPVLMVLLNTVGLSYRRMRGRWREVTVAILTIAALFTPADIITMFMVTIPLMAAYATGIAVLFVLTLGGRRDLAPAPGTSDA
ncbi:preprotein translocase subunit TatC [Haloprofundus marisrubri]|uniref:Sec-independent protein translocase protein TatC n=1 Tax=Haloprofundus marisrubri TaxID=1514971 RepID=A0A0W1R3W2_9EURY|nr:twin-arginine translocase subunit TatC [Haloprofundus marisrubri]KTG08156.1 preprotein translocase subunit TatC [Haloprofundus marisrubri]